jgi:hypothetical protein
MSAQKMVCFKQGDQGGQNGLMNNVLLSRCVLPKPSPPILLPLTADPLKPPTLGCLPEETQEDGKPNHLKPPIIQMRSQGMDGPTIGTTIPLEKQGPLKLVKEAAHITMTPQPWAPAPRTPGRTWPRIVLSHLLKELDIKIKIQYQGDMSWRDNWGHYSWQGMHLGYPFSFPSTYSEKKEDLYNKP